MCRPESCPVTALKVVAGAVPSQESSAILGGEDESAEISSNVATGARLARPAASPPAALPDLPVPPAAAASSRCTTGLEGRNGRVSVS